MLHRRRHSISDDEGTEGCAAGTCAEYREAMRGAEGFSCFADRDVEATAGRTAGKPAPAAEGTDGAADEPRKGADEYGIGEDTERTLRTADGKEQGVAGGNPQPTEGRHRTHEGCRREKRTAEQGDDGAAGCHDKTLHRTEQGDW